MRSERGSDALLGLAAGLPTEIAFLAGQVPEAALLACACGDEDRAPQAELIASGAISAEAYAGALARHLGGTFQSSLHPDTAGRHLLQRRGAQAAASLGLFMLSRGADGITFAVDAESKKLGRVLQALRQQPYAGKRIVVATGAAFRVGLARALSPQAVGPDPAFAPTPAEFSAKGAWPAGRSWHCSRPPWSCRCSSPWFRASPFRHC